MLSVHLGFVRMNAFNDLDDANAFADLRDRPTPLSVRIAAGPVTTEDEELEEKLLVQAWFPYRRLDPVQRTHLFVQEYDRIYLSLVDKNTDVGIELRERMKKRGHYLWPGEVATPWQQLD